MGEPRFPQCLIVNDMGVLVLHVKFSFSEIYCFIARPIRRIERVQAFLYACIVVVQ